MTLNILEYLENTASRLGEKLAFSTGKEGMTFSEVYEGARAILKSFLQHHSLKASILRFSAFFMVQLSHLYMILEKP